MFCARERDWQIVKHFGDVMYYVWNRCKLAELGKRWGHRNEIKENSGSLDPPARGWDNI
jgi:hypothetical protein